MTAADASPFRPAIPTSWGLASPQARVLALIVVATALRIAFAAATDLSNDESYTIATGRVFALSTYDHPPLAWWISRLAALCFGSESPLAVRLPFIALSAFSTWQMYRLTARLFSAEAGVLAALVLSCAPVLGVTSASWVLPDGPLIAALVSGALVLSRVLFDEDAPPWLWLVAGVWGGLALLSKYHGIFLFAGTFLFLLTSARHRHWLATPWPYAGAIIAAVMFCPVVYWNAQHHWSSFAFQAERGLLASFRPWMPLVTLAGQSLLLYPAIWLALVVSGWRAFRSGVAEPKSWLLFCLGIGPVAIFTLSSAWGSEVMFHWAAPGYLMWVPLVGADLERWLARAPRLWRFLISATAALIAALVVTVSVVSVAPIPWSHFLKRDPLYELRSWDELHDALAAHHLLGRSDLFVGTITWHLAGRIDYAIHGEMPVVCLCGGGRGIAVLRPVADYVGRSAILVIPTNRVAQSAAQTGAFESLEPIDEVTIHHGNDEIEKLSLFYGRTLKRGTFP